MKTNGTVHHLEGIPSGYKRSWEANCLLCEWLSRKGRVYASKNAANLGIRRHLRVIHDLKSEERLVEER